MLEFAALSEELRRTIEIFVLGQVGRFQLLRTEEPGFQRDLVLYLPPLITGTPVGGVDAQEAATRLVASAEASVGLGGPGDLDRDEMLVFAVAVQALAGGDPQLAVDQLLDASVDRGLVGPRWPAWYLLFGEALARVGRTDEAIRVFGSRIKNSRPLKQLRLGELYEEIGDEQAARVHYKGFLRLFQNADEDADALVQRGRDGLARVGG